MMLSCDMSLLIMYSSIGVLIFSFLLALGFVLFVPALFSSKHRKTVLRLPPGPWGLPILGHLHMLGELPHRSLQTMAKKYGPIMSIRLGLVQAIVVSSPEYAELFFRTHDSVFADRPVFESSKYMAYGSKSLVFAKYGPYWRYMRKFCTKHLLCNSMIESFEPIRKQHVAEFIHKIKTTTADSIDVTAMVGSLVFNITCQMIFGLGGNRFDLNPSLREVVILCGVYNVADYIPFIGALDIQGYRRRMKTVHKVIDEFLEKKIDEHVQDASSRQGQHRDFTDVILSSMDSNTEEVHIGRDNVKAILLDMVTASTDSPVLAIEWTVAELLKNPRVMKLVQEELKNVVGLDRVVEEEDLEKLEYLKMVVKESIRLHPIIPLNIHKSMEDVSMNGHFIPKNSILMVNTWAIGQDPNVWSNNAQDFYPERFAGATVDLQGHDYQLLPFGSGRRVCPGLRLALTTIEFVVAQLLHCFDLKLPRGMSPSDLDMDEKYGFSLPRANHLVAVPTYRLVTK